MDEVFTNIELSDSAIKKLFLDEDLTDREWAALFRSDYLQPSDVASEEEASCVLYGPSTLSTINSAPFLFTDIESEAISYFAKHPELLFSLHPRRFEELVASIFKTNGFDVELTPESRDGGVDVFAVRKDGISGGLLHLIECKRYEPSNKVGIGVVQRLLGVVDHHRATKGLVITTSTFSSDAISFASQSKYRLGLNDYSDLTKWMRDIQGK
ncbi:MAG: restriction endonuclease [Rhodocyclaceae bacterium]|nr:restriction endonuclease [Rhodocyclaceae bacterium]